MSKKHFEAMAEEIRNMRATAKSSNLLMERAQGAEDALVVVAIRFNPLFDAARFRAACWPNVAGF